MEKQGQGNYLYARSRGLSDWAKQKRKCCILRWQQVYFVAENGLILKIRINLVF